jgi:crotonobetainyl-CoA:carnitine CoA-transferase CaiB-like acyl-CoA transferase
MMLSRTYQEWAERFEAHEVMYGPVNNMEDILKDPHLIGREMFAEVEHPQAGKHKIVGTPMKFSRTPCKINKAAPELGADTTDILSTWLDLSEEEIQKLRESKTI